MGDHVGVPGDVRVGRCVAAGAAIATLGTYTSTVSVADASRLPVTGAVAWSVSVPLAFSVLAIAQVSVYSPAEVGAVHVCDAPRIDVGWAVLPLASGPNAKLEPMGHDHRYWSMLLALVLAVPAP